MDMSAVDCKMNASSTRVCEISIDVLVDSTEIGGAIEREMTTFVTELTVATVTESSCKAGINWCKEYSKEFKWKRKH
uniref:Ovule protein n=1 Tax=Rhabditophanes sp. KR3021 TaxID=114890 RepID=A0AC35U409_9BILA